MPRVKAPASQTILDPLPIPPKAAKSVPPPTARKKPAAPKSRPLFSRYERFLIPALLLFMLGNALAYALPQLPLARPGIGLSLCGILVGLVVYATGQGTGGRWKIRLSLWMLFLLAGSLFYRQFHSSPEADDVSTFAPLDHAEVMGTIEGFLNPTRAIIRVGSINGQPASGQVSAALPRYPVTENPQSTLEAGTRVLITADLRRPFQSRIPGAFDQEKYLAGRQITALLNRPERLLSFEMSNDPGYVLQRTAERLKSRIAATFSRYLPSPQAEVLGGIVLGDKAVPVDRDTRQAFIQTGLVHILAASGLNVGIIAGAVLWLLSRFRWNYRAKLLAAMGAVAFYSLLTGLPPSIQRAATMLEIALFLKLLNRSLSPILLLCLAGSVLLLLHPDHIGSIGFQFSMLTTFGLVTMVSPLQEKLGYYITRWAAGLILVPLVAQLWVWPLSVYYFNQFPIHSVPLNLLAMMLVAPLTLIGFTSASVSLVFPALGGWMSVLSTPFLNGLLLLAQWGHSQTWAQWTLPSPSPVLLCLLYVQLFVMLAVLRFGRKMPPLRKALFALLPLAVMLGMLCLQKASAQKEAQIALLPLSFRHEGYLLKPAGSAQHLAVLPAGISYYEARAVTDYLRHRGVSSLEALILLPEPQGEDQASARSARGLLRMLNVPVQRVLTTPDLAKLLNTSKKTRLFPTEGLTLHSGNLVVRAQFPRLQVLSDQRCLLELSESYQADSLCGVRVVQEAFGLRLYSVASLDSAQYYELRQQNARLHLYQR